LLAGLGEVKCDVCDGQGSLARGGFHKRNPVAIERIVGELLLAVIRSFLMVGRAESWREISNFYTFLKIRFFHVHECVIMCFCVFE
jgi:hypothetical protein